MAAKQINNINIKAQNQTIKAWQAAVVALIFFVSFFYAGNGLPLR